MCRFAASATAEERPLATLLFDAPHSLEKQSYRPHEMVAGTINVDGTGVAWWSGREDEPLLYVSERPPWSDPNLPRLARRLTGRIQLACVRSATPGMSFGPESVQPFVHRGVAGALNGYIGRFRDRLARTIALRLPEELFGRLVSGSDASALFLLAVSHLDGGSPASLARAAAEAVREVGDLCEKVGVAASLNLLLASTEGIAAVRHARGVQANSLYWRRGAGGELVVASEPLDDGGWEGIAAGHVAYGDATASVVMPIEGPFR